MPFDLNAGFVAPIGIPAPTFGIEERAPPPPPSWPDAPSDGYYYIDASAPNASDTDNPYGSPAHPRKSFPTQRTFGPGTVIELHGGPYESIGWRTFRCTRQAPCFIRGPSTTDRAHLHDTLELRDSTYVIVENLIFADMTQSAVTLWGASQYIGVRRNEVRDATWRHNSAGMATAPQPGSDLHDVVFFRNAFCRLGDWRVIDSDPDFHGVTPSTWGRTASEGGSAHQIWVLENACEHLSGNCVQVNAGNGAGAAALLHHVYVGRNWSHENRQAGYWCKQATDVIFSQNVSMGHPLAGGQPGDGGGFQYNPDYLWFLFNDFSDANFGIRQSDTSGGDPAHVAFFIGNFIHDNDDGLDPAKHWGSPTGWGVSLWSGNQTRYIVDNTIVNTRGGIELIHAGPTIIEGNIIVSGLDAPLLAITREDAASQTTLGVNLFFDPRGDALYRFGTPKDLRGLSAMQAASGQCGACIEADPLFTGPTTGDYTLAAGSPGRGAGHRSEAYQIFFDRYGIDIDVDARGQPRPHAGPRDLGAFEH